jgi:Fe-S-cluster containining protein
MNLKARKKELKRLYAEFEEQVGPFRRQAVCEEGCADCCTNVGEVHTTTLEGLLILEKLKAFSVSAREAIWKKLDENRAVKEQNGRGAYARCPFLGDDDLCTVYRVRPFACRRLYSVKRCGESGPVVHREFWELAERATVSIQRLDEYGYSGHISFVLQLLRDPAFRKVYVGGGFDPESVRDYAAPRGIVINRIVEPRAGRTGRTSGTEP